MGKNYPLYIFIKETLIEIDKFFGTEQFHVRTHKEMSLSQKKCKPTLQKNAAAIEFHI